MKNRIFPIHYAWIICLSGFILFFMSVGLVNNSYAVYQPYFLKTFGLTQTQLSFMNTCRLLSGFLSLSVLGLYYRNINVRFGILIGCFILIAGYFFFALAKGYFALVIGCCLSGFGVNLTGAIPISLLIDRWFLKRRNLAMSLFSSSSGIATFIAPQLIARSISRFGLSSTLAGQAITMLLLSLLCYLLFIEFPTDKHLAPFGVECDTPAKAAASPKKEPPPLGKGLWVSIYAMLTILGAVCGCALAVLPLIANSQGYSDSQMATAVSLGGISLLVGKLAFGWFSEKITQYKTSMLFSFFLVLGVSFLVFSRFSVILLYAGAVFFIGSISMAAIGLVSWPADWAPEREWPRLRQLFNLLYCVGSMVFSIVPGVLADRFGGSYQPTVYILLVGGLICFFFLYWTYKTVNKKIAEANASCGE